jgi:hypothetical protein
MSVRMTTHQFQNDGSPIIFSRKAIKAGLIKHVWVGKPRPASSWIIRECHLITLVSKVLTMPRKKTIRRVTAPSPWRPAVSKPTSP